MKVARQALKRLEGEETANLTLCVRLLEERARAHDLVLLSREMALQVAGFLRRLQVVP